MLFFINELKNKEINNYNYYKIIIFFSFFIHYGFGDYLYINC